MKKNIHDIKNNSKKWFKRRSYGWGWFPSTWQGWLVTFIYLLAVFVFALSVDEHSSKRDILFTFVIPIALLTVTFLKIAYKKGERPKWTWGKHS